MFVIIAGGGRTGAQLATLLVKQEHKIHLIEHRREVLARLHRELPTEVIYEGSATDPHILEQAGVTRANALAACTVSDTDNLVLCFLARTLYQVPRTIARINNPRNAWLFDQKFHVDVALNQAEILANMLVEEMSMGDMVTLLKLRRGQYSLVEEKIPPTAKAVGCAIEDLLLPGQCTIAAIIRAGEMILPRGQTILAAGDEILAIADQQGVAHLVDLFAAGGGCK